MDANRVRRNIGIVFQAFNLFPHMTVLENITLAPRKVLGKSRADAEGEALELLTRFGLADKAGEYPDRISGRALPASLPGSLFARQKLGNTH